MEKATDITRNLMISIQHYIFLVFISNGMIWAGYLARVEEVRSGIYVFGRET
jgi:hypothetical protein